MKKIILTLCIVLFMVFTANAGTLVVKWTQSDAVVGDSWEIAKNNVRFATINYISGQTSYTQDLTGLTIDINSDIISVRKVNVDGYISPWVDGVYKLVTPPTDVEIYLNE